MIVRLIANQIPHHWELIKFALDKVSDEGTTERKRAEAVDILHDLLSNKAQAWVRLDDNRTITSVFVTRITTNRLNPDEKYFGINCVYSFRGAQNDTWEEDWKLFKDFAHGEGCTYIYFRSHNRRIWELAEMMGCEEKHRTYAMGIA